MNRPVFSDGRYRILGRLGEGGQSVVFRALDRAADREVALKVLAGPIDRQTGGTLMRREFLAMHRISHPGVVRVFDFGATKDGTPFFTMELLEGRPLSTFLEGEPEEAILRTVGSILEALHHIHGRGVIHGDIKPSNVLAIEGNGRMRIKLLDFGLSALAGVPSFSSGVLRGSVHYMAPEVIRDAGVDGRADLYSLGATLYEILAGEPLFAGLNPGAVLRNQVEKDPPPLRASRPDLSAGMRDLVMRLLEKNVRLRFPTAVAARQAVARLLGETYRETGEMSREALTGSFSGREAEIDLARSMVRESRRGNGGVLVIQGELGSGKSRLLSEIRVRCQLMGARVVGPATSSTAVSYSAWLPCVQVLSEGKESGGGLFASATESGGGEGLSEEDGESRRLGFLEETCRELHERTRTMRDDGESLVLLIDGLDEIDSGSRALLAFVSRQIASLPLVVIATTASSAGRGRDYPPDARTVTLEPLTLTETGHLAAGMLGTSEVPKRLSTILLDESMGNPADVEDLVRALLDEGALVRDKRGGIRIREEMVSRLPATQRMENWLKKRVAAIDAESRFALSVASLLPDPFPPDLLATALGFSVELVFDVLGRLEACGILTCCRGHYRFRTARMRRYLVGGLARSSLCDLSDRIAGALQVSDDASPRLLGDYLAAGKNPRAAVPWLIEAAEKSYRECAVDDSIDSLKAAVSLIIGDGGKIDVALLNSLRERLADRLCDIGESGDAIGLYESLVPESTDPETGFRLRLKLAGLYGRRGEYERAHDELKTVLGALDRDRDKVRIADLLAKIGWTFKNRGLYAEALVYGDRALKVALEDGDPLVAAAALNLLGGVHYGRGDLVQAERCYRSALLALEGQESDAQTDPLNPEILAHAPKGRARVLLNNLGNVFWKTGQWEEALFSYRQALCMAEATGNLSGMAAAANNVALIQYGRGHWDEAIEGFLQSLSLKTKLGELPGVGVALFNLAEVHERVGRWGEAEEELNRCLDVKRRLLDSKGEGVVRLTLGNLHRKRGEAAAAEQEINAGAALLSEAGFREGIAYAAYYRALLQKDREDFVSALRLMNEALSILDEGKLLNQSAQVLTSTADLYMRMGDLDKALSYAERSRGLAMELGDRFEQGKILSVLGRLHYLRRDRDSARQAFEQGISTLEELGAQFEIARSAYEYGLRIEDPARAIRQIDKAITIFRRIGAIGDVERAAGTRERIEQNIHRFDAPESSAGEVIGLYEIGKIINSMRDLDDVLERILDLVLARTKADRGMILLLDARGALRVRAARNISRENLKGISDISASIVHEVIRTQGPLLASNASSDPRLRNQESIVVHGIVSIASVPLTIRDRIAGAIYLDHRSEPDHFTKRDLRFLEAFADAAAMAIESARLYRELREASERLAAENLVLRAEIRPRDDAVFGGSRSFQTVLDLARKAAMTGETTLLLGESGTGKSFLAREIHDMGARHQGPFVKFNCAALPESLVESELFGYERGAFTGAEKRKLGRFEIASDGTIFLDEIGNISKAVQAKLLRILEDKEFERLGGTETRKTRAQIITATNQDLQKAVREGSFREDLYYRLNVFPIAIPPLRERIEDIFPLAKGFLQATNAELGLAIAGFRQSAVDLLLSHGWPGNVRELKSAVRRAAVLAEEGEIREEDLRFLRGPEARSAQRESILEEAVESFLLRPRKGEKLFAAVTGNIERILVKRVLDQCQGQIREAARRLGIARNTLRSKMRKFDLIPSEAERAEPTEAEPPGRATGPSSRDPG